LRIKEQETRLNLQEHDDEEQLHIFFQAVVFSLLNVHCEFTEENENKLIPNGNEQNSSISLPERYVSTPDMHKCQATYHCDN